MRHLVIVLTVVALCNVPLPTQACDICGCSGSSGSSGLLPLVQKHFIGVRSQWQGFATKPHGSGLHSTEWFRSVELWGRWQPHRRAQLFFSVPYTFNERRFENGDTQALSGIGDVATAFQWSLLDPRRQSARLWRHTLQAGIGVKWATGAFQRFDAESGSAHANLQPGTGSTDFLFTALYALRYRDWGVSVDGSGRWNRSNADDYRFGNRLDAAARLFYTRSWGKWTLLPQVGVQVDLREKDQDSGAVLSESGGYAVAALAGFDAFAGPFVLGLHAAVPVSHHLARGYVTPQPRLQASLTFLFGGKKSGVLTPVVAPRPFENISN